MKNNNEPQELQMSALANENTSSNNENSGNRNSFLHEAEKQIRKVDMLFRRYTIDGIGGGYQGL